MLAETSAVQGNIHLGTGGAKHVIIYAGAGLDGDLISEGSHSSLTLLTGPSTVLRETRLQRVDGFDTASVQGGGWVFAGEMFIETVEVEAGHVLVDGVLSSGSVLVRGGLLGGSGSVSVSGSVENASGIVAPGRSMGVLSIQRHGGTGGHYVQGPDVVLELEISAVPNPQPGVDHDQLRVAGIASFADGTTIRVVPRPGVYRRGVHGAADGGGAAAGGRGSRRQARAGEPRG